MIIALDTCAMTFLIGRVPDDELDARRWQNVRDQVGRWQDEGATIIIPAPVVAELASTPGSAGIVEILARRFSQFDTRPLDEKAAEIAGRITQATLPKPPRTEGRQVVKFDATVIATAVRWGASVLATTDDRDFAKYIEPLKPQAIEVVQADQAPRHVTLSIIGT